MISIINLKQQETCDIVEKYWNFIISSWDKSYKVMTELIITIFRIISFLSQIPGFHTGPKTLRKQISREKHSNLFDLYLFFRNINPPRIERET